MQTPAIGRIACPWPAESQGLLAVALSRIQNWGTMKKGRTRARPATVLAVLHQPMQTTGAPVSLLEAQGIFLVLGD